MKGKKGQLSRKSKDGFIPLPGNGRTQQTIAPRAVPSSYVEFIFKEVMYKESWALKNWCFWTVVLEKILESPLDCKDIKPVNPKRNQPWIFIGRTVAETEAPIVWPPDTKDKFTGKDLDAGEDWRQRRSGQQRIRWLLIITNSVDMNLSKLWEMVEDRGDWCATAHGAAKSQVWLCDWTTTAKQTCKHLSSASFLFLHLCLTTACEFRSSI